MAREQRRDVDYFPHECNHGRKMYVIQKKYGNDGYASWFKLLEELGKANNHYIDISDDTTLMFLASTFDIDEEKTISILTDLSKLGAINKTLFNDYKVIWSEKFTKSIEDAYRKRKQKLFQYYDVLDEITSKNTKNEAELADKHINPREIGGINPQSKEEYIKEEETKEEETKDTPIGVVDLKNQPPVPKIDFIRLIAFFNLNRGLLPEVKKMSDVRKKRIQLLEKQYGKESIQIVIEKCRDSPFLQGDNKENWVANFDWILKPANFLKILEDTYARKQNTRSSNSSTTDAEHKQSAVSAVNAMFGVQQ